MTVPDFLTEVQGYYGRYNDTQRKYVQAWLERQKPKRLPGILRHVFLRVSAALRMPPGIKELQEALNALYEEDELSPRQEPVRQDKPRPTAAEQKEVARFLQNLFEKLDGKGGQEN
jgi:hypothetical protein